MKKLTAILLTVITVFMLFTASAFAYNGSTSFEFRYPDAFEKAKKEYSSFTAALIDDLSATPIPGNITSDAYSSLTGKTTTENMVPQGICVTDEYILVTAYDSEKEFNSVIYVISKDDNTLLSTIIMPDKNHSGGIETDGKNIYVAKDKNGVAVFSCGIIEEAVNENGVYVLEKYENTTLTEDTASFITFYDGKMWVGKFNEKEDSYLYDYTINADGTLTRGTVTYTLPQKLQGASFFEKDGKTWLICSNSYGRTKTSSLYVYEINGSEAKQTLSYVFPPMAEETDIYNGVVYMIFESSATEYSTKESRCPTPVDRITALDAEKITNSKTQNKFADFWAKIRSFFMTIFDFFTSLFRR